MAWFKVDDGLHDHRKTRKVRRSHPDKKRDVAPFGLWVLAGSWAGANETSGFVPTEVLEEWDDDSVVLAARLVDAGLWWPTVVDGEQGFGFHDWDDRNPVSEVDSGRFGNHLRWHVKRQMPNPECSFCISGQADSIGANRGDDRGESGTISPPDSSPVPTRPDPSRPERPCASADAERGDIEADFTRWYLTYPRKRGKGQALKAYRGARKKASAQELTEALARQIPALTARGEEFTPYPATWLNGERWTDEAAQPQQQTRLPQAHELELPPDGLSPEQYAAWDAKQRAKRLA